MEEPIITDEELERGVARLLAEDAERRRPDRRGPRGNGEADPGEVEAGLAKLDRLLG